MAELGLTEAIKTLREELFGAIVEGHDELLKFEPGPIELELQLALMATAGASVGFKWVVVSLGGEAKGQYTNTHKVKLTLKPILGGREKFQIAADAQRPK